MTLSVLLVDPDFSATELLASYLRREGWVIHVAHTGSSSLKQALNQPVDVIVLELAVTQPSGFDVLTTLRAQLTVPIIILTQRSDSLDHCLAFEMGADDYLVKPCDPYDVIRSIRRRVQGGATQPNVVSGQLIFNNMVLDFDTHSVNFSGKRLDLTQAEFNIMSVLLKSPGHVFSKKELTEYALGRKYTAYDRSIDVHISHLRNKLGVAWIKTVRGYGYLLEAATSSGVNEREESLC